MGFNMIIIKSSFIIAFTEIIKVKLVHPRFPPPPVLPRHNRQCPKDQPFSLVTQTAGPHRFQHSILSPHQQPPYRPSFMKRPSRWSTSPTIQTAQGRGDIAS